MDKPVWCIIIAISMGLASCRGRDADNPDRYLDEEISSRLNTFIKHDTVGEVVKRVNDIHRLSGQLILLSKDVENLNASVSRGNSYFTDLASELGVAQSAMQTLHSGMSVDEISATIKSNELYLLNYLSAEHYPEGINLHSAQ